MSATGNSQWQWQEEGSSWRGVGIYHLTLTLPSRAPLLGSLEIPGRDPAQAYVEATELGRALLTCQCGVPTLNPPIQLLQYCLMPDHLHSIWYVRAPMEKSIRQVAQGFWRAAKKLGRAYSFLHGVAAGAAAPAAMAARAARAAHAARLTGGPIDERGNPSPGPLPAAPLSGASLPAGPLSGASLPAGPLPSGGFSLSSIAPASSRANPLREMLGDEVYYGLAPLFTEMPFIRPLSRRGQLQAMIRYVQLNPQRLATKRLMPGYFRVQEGIAIAGRTYAGVGNAALLLIERRATVHVRSVWVRAAEHGEAATLRNYMNGCVIAARQGALLVSPFISEQEKAVQTVLLREQHPFILLADNGFRDYYKPSAVLFDAVAAGRVLILSPWPYDAGKRHISRADCVALNTMAEEIAQNP